MTFDDVKDEIKLIMRLIKSENKELHEMIVKYMIISGGIIPRLRLLDKSVDGDLDIFFLGSISEGCEAFNKIKKLTEKSKEKLRFEQLSVKEYDNTKFTAFRVHTNLTNFKYINFLMPLNENIFTPFDVVNKFDFIHLKSWYDPHSDRLTVTNSAMESLTTKKIDISKAIENEILKYGLPKYENSLTERIEKYMAMGMVPSNEMMEKLRKWKVVT